MRDVTAPGARRHPGESGEQTGPSDNTSDPTPDPTTWVTLFWTMRCEDCASEAPWPMGACVVTRCTWFQTDDGRDDEQTCEWLVAHRHHDLRLIAEPS